MLNSVRPVTTERGRRNFEKLVSLASSDPGDRIALKSMADSLAALLAEVTPSHREVLASQMTRLGAGTGRFQAWRLPPGLAHDDAARRKWAAVVLLDCVDAIADSQGSYHSLAERASWREHAKLYTQGAESLPIKF